MRRRIRMSKKSNLIGVRFPPDLLEALQAFAQEEEAALQKRLPGLTFSPSEAIRTLVQECLQRRGKYPPMDAKESTMGETRRDRIEAALRSGDYVSQSQLARDLGTTQPVVSRAKRKLLDAGEDLPKPQGK
jgi:Arc/MetJ-type ribon-helix-helix transcriptional regulator